MTFKVNYGLALINENNISKEDMPEVLDFYVNDTRLNNLIVNDDNDLKVINVLYGSIVPLVFTDNADIGKATHYYVVYFAGHKDQNDPDFGWKDIIIHKKLTIPNLLNNFLDKKS